MIDAKLEVSTEGEQTNVKPVVDLVGIGNLIAPSHHRGCGMYSPIDQIGIGG